MSLQAPGSNWLKWLLWPFSLIWGLIALARRFWFARVGKRFVPPVPTIVIGNLSAGGTGKTPMIKWLLARRDQPVAVLSRGYGRKSRGFLEVLHDTSVREAGDEPLEIRHTVAGRHRVFVCENRPEGIRRILEVFPECTEIVLDDGYQHLPLKAHRYVLLSDMARPFYKDLCIPAGWLREFRRAARYADALIFTKCAPGMDEIGKTAMKRAAAKYTDAPVFFTGLEYAAAVPVSGTLQPDESHPVLLVTGIARASYFLEHLQGRWQIAKHVAGDDHQDYTAEDIREWKTALQQNGCAAILTTRKDWMRIRPLCDESLPVWVVDVLPSWNPGEADSFLEKLETRNAFNPRYLQS
ncbi:MAG: tetraacyldisaccharide 4'-kinase [Bacteroidia bacterium]